MKYVQIDDDTGSVTWDAYFEYLRSVRSGFSPSLYAYATDWGHYSLDGVDSLHDAWLLSVQFSYQEQSLVIELLSPRHDRKHSLTYWNVECYAIDLDVKFRFGDRDVLVHEFRAEEGRVVHEIAFPNKKWISVRAADIAVKTELFS